VWGNGGVAPLIGRAMLLAVRGGGHNGAGLGLVDNGLVVDLSDMRGVRVDPEARTARVEGGATTQQVGIPGSGPRGRLRCLEGSVSGRALPKRRGDYLIEPRYPPLGRGSTLGS
jgi:hypothetical protein